MSIYVMSVTNYVCTVVDQNLAGWQTRLWLWNMMLPTLLYLVNNCAMVTCPFTRLVLVQINSVHKSLLCGYRWQLVPDSSETIKHRVQRLLRELDVYTLRRWDTARLRHWILDLSNTTFQFHAAIFVEWKKWNCKNSTACVKSSDP